MQPNNTPANPSSIIRDEKSNNAPKTGTLPSSRTEYDSQDEGIDHFEDVTGDALYPDAHQQLLQSPTSKRSSPQTLPHALVRSPARRPRMSSPQQTSIELHQSQLQSVISSRSEQRDGEEESMYQHGKPEQCTHVPNGSTSVSVEGVQQDVGGQFLGHRHHDVSMNFDEKRSKERDEEQDESEIEETQETAREVIGLPALEEPWSAEEIQRRIRDITKNPILSEAEKNKQRQAVLSQPFQQRRRKETLQFSVGMEQQKYEPSYSNLIDPATSEKMLGCEHYPRNCKIKADCCQMWTVCRLCHDDPSMDHTIDRFKTKEVLCMLCWTTQPVQRDCVKCKVRFASYFCEKCKFYDNTPGKDIYHCDKCTICRVGKGIGHDNFHCDRCDACVSKEYSRNHRCLKKSLDANCPICGTYLFTSTKPVIFMRCGHTMHSHCFDAYTTEHFTCPLCHKALTDMHPYWSQLDERMKREVMPPEYRNRVAEILCHDCDKRSETPLHFAYMKCMAPNCGSYNTALLRWHQKDQCSASSVSGPNEGQHNEGGSDCGDNNYGENDSMECNDINQGMIASSAEDG